MTSRLKVYIIYKPKRIVPVKLQAYENKGDIIMKHLQLHYCKQQDCYKEKCNVQHSHEVILLCILFRVVLW